MDFASTQTSSCTTAPITVDKSNYWIPQLYYYNPQTGGFQAVPVAYMNAYYLPRGGKNDTIRAFPDGLRMVSGNPSRRTFDKSDIDNQAISYVCLDYSNDHRGDPAWDQRNDFFAHNCPHGLRAQVNFRTCWNGKDLDSEDHRSHMSWPINSNNNGGGDCPASHPVKVVQVFYEFIFEVQRFPFNPAGTPTWVWANGDTTGYGLHADFLNGWGKGPGGVNVLQRAIDECNINNGVGGNLEACPPFQGLINRAASKGCQPQNPLVSEDVGFGHEIPRLPGNNPIWIGNGTKPTYANYTESSTEYSNFRSVLPSNWDYVGCVAEAVSGRALDAYSFSSNNMTRGLCAAECGKRGFALAGVQAEKECWCDAKMKRGASNTTLLPVERCNFKCAGLTAENCGGSRTIDLMVNPTLFPPPLKVQAGWEYQGCYEGQASGARILSSTETNSDALTAESCVKFCHNAGFSLAGAEYGRECRCGNALRTPSNQVSEEQCSMPCAGDSRYSCGDGNRVSLFKYTGKAEAAPGTTNPTNSTSTSNAIVPAGVEGWFKQERNCFTEPSAKRALTGYSTYNGQMSGAACMKICQGKGYAFAGTEYSSECFCGSSLDSASKEAPMSDCKMACSGSSTESCGGSSRLSLYFFSNTSSSSTSPSIPTGPSNANINVPGWVDQGCYSEATSGRALASYSFLSSNLTIPLCLSACQARGYRYCGAEYSSECFGSNVLREGAVPVSDGCTMTCSGDKSTLCGGPSRLNVFEFPAAAITSTTSATTTTTTTTVPAASTTPSAATGSSGNPNWTSRGCYAEGGGIRTVSGGYLSTGNMTLALCSAFAESKNHTMLALVYGRECFTGTAINPKTNATAEVECNFACVGAKSEKCGGNNRASVFQFVPPTPAPAPAPIAGSAGMDLPGGWKMTGCIVDGDGTGGQRAFRESRTTSQDMTWGLCASTCAKNGYNMGGVSYGAECYCGNVRQAQAVDTDISQCNMSCSGDKGVMCGGSWRLNMLVGPGANTALASASTSSSTTTSTTTTTGATPTTSVGSSTIATATASTTATESPISPSPKPNIPTATVEPLPAPTGYLGCFTDHSDRQLNGTNLMADDKLMSNTYCVKYCKDRNFAIAGTTYAAECMCGNYLNRSDNVTLSDPNGCSMPCKGQPETQKCGASWQLSVYLTGMGNATIYDPPAKTPAGGKRSASGWRGERRSRIALWA